MTDLDPELQAKLRELADARVRQQIASAKARRAQQDATRRQFAERRRVGLRQRHALKTARQNLTADHNRQNGDQQP